MRPQPATLRAMDGGCNPLARGLQPCVLEAATLRARGGGVTLHVPEPTTRRVQVRQHAAPNPNPHPHRHRSPLIAHLSPFTLTLTRYDNTLRLYDAPLHWSQPQPQPQQPLAAAAAGAPAERAAAPSGAEPAGGALECLHRLAGHKNRHWPIKSSIFVGHDYVRGAAQRRSAHSPEP